MTDITFGVDKRNNRFEIQHIIKTIKDKGTKKNPVKDLSILIVY